MRALDLFCRVRRLSHRSPGQVAVLIPDPSCRANAPRIGPQYPCQSQAIVSLGDDAWEIGSRRIADHDRIRPRRIPKEKHGPGEQHRPMGGLSSTRLGDEPSQIPAFTRGEADLRNSTKPWRRIGKKSFPTSDTDQPLVDECFRPPRSEPSPFLGEVSLREPREDPRHAKMDQRPSRYVQCDHPRHWKLKRHGMLDLSN